MRRKQETKTASGGVGITGLLGTAFVALRLCGVIKWSWWWVLSPFWISLLLVIALVIIAVIVDMKN